MINEEKVKLMTKLEIYESTKGKSELPLSHYYKSDYVRFQVFKTVVTSTIAFMLLAVFVVLANLETLMVKINSIDLVKTAYVVGAIYIIFVLLYMLLARILYAKRYEEVKPDIIVYNHNLKQLKEFYEEEKTTQRKIEERSVGKENDEFIDY